MDREAAPVNTDDQLMQLIRPLLAGTQLETEVGRTHFIPRCDK